MRRSNWVALSILIISPLFILVAIVLSVIYGAKDIHAETIWQAITQFDANNVDHSIIMTSRLPRVIAALFVGAFLAVSGALMQGITRNYLASPSIMGVTDGSSFVITLAIAFFPGMPNYKLVLLSMIGSALGAGIVFGFGMLIRDGFSPVRLAIIGTVIGSFLSSIAAAIAMRFQVSQTVSLWYSSKIHKVDPGLLKIAVPIGLIGLLIAVAVSKSVTIASLGEDIASGLGLRTKWVKVMSMVAVACMTGTAVALVGKIGFVGLVIPHITRFITGSDYRYVIPCAAVIGGVFLAFCDIFSRFVNFPFETPVGVVTAFIGIPFFLYLIRSRGGRQNA